MTIANLPSASDFQSWLWNQAPSIIFLALALWFVGSALVKQNAKYNKLQDDRLAEYKGRIDSIEAKNDLLEKRVDECEDDRRDLRRRIEGKP